MHILQQVVFVQIGFTDDCYFGVVSAVYGSCFEIPVFQNLKSRQFVFQSKHHLFEFLIDLTVSV